jgi:hypothetical protein
MWSAEQFVKDLDARLIVVWNGPGIAEELSCSLHAGATPYYEITFPGPPSSTHLVKMQVYAPVGVGEDTGFEMAFE